MKSSAVVPPATTWAPGTIALRHCFYRVDAHWRSNIKLHHVRHFDAVAQHSSIHGAARALGIAQSAISRSLRELEHQLGVILFERGRSGAVLTEAGKRFRMRATRIQEELRRSMEDASQASGEGEGSVAIAMSASAQMVFIPRIVGRFRERWPRVRLTILDGLAGDFESRLLDGTLDFFFGVKGDLPLHASLSVDSVARMPRAIVARPDSQWANVRSLADLADAPWVQAGFTETAADHLAGVFEANGLAPSAPIMVAPSMLTTLLLLESADAVALVPSVWVQRWPAAGSFVRVPVEDPLGTLDIACVRRQGLPLTPAAQHLLDMLLEADTGTFHGPGGGLEPAANLIHQ